MTEVRLAWDPSAWEDCTYWQTADRRILKRVNALIDACLRDPFGGIGKPEQLRYGAPGAWSRRITEEHRLVYLVDGDDLVILQARYHYLSPASCDRSDLSCVGRSGEAAYSGRGVVNSSFSSF